MLSDRHQRLFLAWCLVRRGFEFEDLAYDPLVGREPVSASSNRWTNESLETEKIRRIPQGTSNQLFLTVEAQ